ncbi:MAG: rhodanese-like domain-containing protein [Rubrivivax sp.]
MSHTTVAELALWQQHGFDFRVIDVRKAAARQAQGSSIAGAAWRDPAGWLDWKDEVAAAAANRPWPVLLVCAHGHELSQGLAAALAAMGVDARWLRGGLAGWQAEGGAVVALPHEDG